jgi:ATP-binding cassette subfamily D (ALD) protein 3
VTNPDQRLTSDIEKWAHSLSQIYSNFSKPLLDIFLFTKKLTEYIGVQAPLCIALWYLFSGFMLKLLSPPFGKYTAAEQSIISMFYP